MKILVTGANGQLGRCLQDVLVNTDHEVFALDRAGLDIGDAEAVNQVIGQHQPQVIINAAAYTAVDKAESEPELAARINTLGPENLAKAAELHQALLIHISTDYVFDGNKTSPYTEEDATNPQGIYGQTKLDGEHAVQQHCSRYVILRTAWVFSEYGNNFVKTMLRLGKERDELSVVSDQIGCPTYAGDIARACLNVLQEDTLAYGIYHYVGQEVCSWYDFADKIMDLGHKYQIIGTKPKVVAIGSDSYPTPAKRPKYSVLSMKQEFYPGVLSTALDNVVRKISQ